MICQALSDRLWLVIASIQHLVELLIVKKLVIIYWHELVIGLYFG